MVTGSRNIAEIELRRLTWQRLNWRIGDLDTLNNELVALQQTANQD
ncbi:hypothetical protein [Amycolatopsis orientalis]|nr:hypothetical protein [Amycolatopsis orientalis]